MLTKLKELFSPKKQKQVEHKVERQNDENLELNAQVVGSVIRGEDRILKDYKLGNKLGEGAFAIVRTAVYRGSRKTFAAKIISKHSDEFDLPSLEKEIAILKQIDHPHCMRLYQVYDEPTKCCLVLELVRGSNMLARMDAIGEPFSEPKAAKVIGDVLSALRCIHSMKICHRDLKPENLMYASDDPKEKDYENIKVCDLGLAQTTSSSADMMRTICGTPGYMAPELLAEKPYDTKVDMWAMGCIMFWMLSDRLPFDEELENLPTTLKHMIEGRVEFPDKQWKSVSENAKDLITQMLNPDPKQRPNATKAQEVPWVKYVGETFEGVTVNHAQYVAMKQMKLFADVSDLSGLATLTNKLRRKIFEPGSVVHSGDTANEDEGGVFNGLFFIESGKVTVARAESAGGEEVAALHEGCFMCSFSVLGGRTSTCRVVVPSGGLPFPATIYCLNETEARSTLAGIPAIHARFAALGALCIRKRAQKQPSNPAAVAPAPTGKDGANPSAKEHEEETDFKLQDPPRRRDSAEALDSNPTPPTKPSSSTSETAPQPGPLRLTPAEWRARAPSSHTRLSPFACDAEPAVDDTPWRVRRVQVNAASYQGREPQELKLSPADWRRLWRATAQAFIAIGRMTRLMNKSRDGGMSWSMHHLPLHNTNKPNGDDDYDFSLADTAAPQLGFTRRLSTDMGLSTEDQQLLDRMESRASQEPRLSEEHFDDICNTSGGLFWGLEKVVQVQPTQPSSPEAAAMPGYTAKNVLSPLHKNSAPSLFDSSTLKSYEDLDAAMQDSPQQSPSSKRSPPPRDATSPPQQGSAGSKQGSSTCCVQ